MTDLQSRIAALSPEQRALLESRVAERAAARGTAPKARIQPRDRSRPTPLAIAQQREWAIERLRAANNISGAFRVEGDLDLSLLGQVLTELVERHEVLRSTVELADGRTPVQVTHPVTPVPTPVVDLSHLTPEEQQGEVRRLCKAEILRPFDPKDPLRLRIFLMKLAEDRHVALFITDHAASDAWSLAIVVQEVVALYGIQGNDGDLPEPGIQFGDFATWQREEFGTERMAAELQHWRQTLSGAPAGLALPTDRPYPARPTFAGDELCLDLSPEFTAALRRFGDRENASLFMILLAGCSVLMQRYLGQDDLVIGSLVSGRTRVETERLIGCFANPVPLRVRLSEDQTLRSVVQEARETMTTALDHQDLPFDRLIEELGLGRESSQTSLSRLWINVLTVPDSTLELPGLRIVQEPIDLGLASIDLTLSAAPRGDVLQLQWQYMTELFDADTVARLAEQFRHVLRQIVETPDIAVRDVEFASGARASAPSASSSRAEPAGFVELFQRRVLLAPNAPAVICDSVATSYADLNRDANRLAHELHSRGVGRETRVGILVDRSPQLAVAILGVLKVGGAYVPLDPSYPPDRLAFLLADAGAQVLVTQPELIGLVGDGASGRPDEVVLLTGPSAPAGDGDDHDLPELPDPTALAYLVYTSGSTGRPKGAMIEHRSLVTFAQDVKERFGLGAGDRFLQFASPAFDVLVEELFPIWLAGGAVVIPTQHLISGQGDLVDLLERERLTVIELPTAYWHEWTRELDRLGRELPSSLRLVIIGGERLLGDRLVLWRRLGVPLMHVYGLTETTVSSTFFRVDPVDQVDWPNLPIGTPLPSAELRILDRRLRPVPEGGSGELYIGGTSVARGYLGRPGLTALRFIADPDPARPGHRLYRTGDQVRQRADGNLEFISRVDTQIKIRGFRVEPAEIESVLSRHPQVAESVVVMVEPTPGDRRLVAYLVTNPNAVTRVNDLRSFLERELPPYMVPSAFVELDALPLSPNGKLDRARLPAPDGIRPDLIEDYVSPQTPLQQTLADIVAAVVALSEVGIHDNFFDLGGDSIQAIQVVARAQEAGIGLSPLDFFEHPTIALLAQAATSSDGGRIISPRPPDAQPVLSFDQERLWLENQLRPRTAYHVGGRQRLIGPLRVEVMEASVRAILVRHEALRTRFPTVDGRPIQVVEELSDDWHLDVVDLSHVHDEVEREETALRLMDEQVTTPFNLAEGPLIRCLVVRISDTEHLLSITAHHIVSDVWSVGLFGRDLLALYQVDGDVSRSGLPPLPIQYSDFAVWQRGWMVGEALGAHVDYWRRHLAGAPPALAMPVAELSPGAGGDRVLDALSKEETAALHDMCRSHGVTLFMAVLASLGVVLGRWSGQPDVVIGSSMSDRTDIGTENLIGFFINTLPLRVDTSARPTFSDLLRQIRQLALDGYAHADAPVDVLVKELQVQRDPRCTPLFQVILNVVEFTPVQQIGEFTMKPMDIPQLLSSFDHIFTAEQAHGALWLRLEFNAERYQAPMMRALLDSLAAFLREVVADPSKNILDYLLPGADEETVGIESSAVLLLTAPHQAVEWYAQLSDRPAVIDRDGEWSYRRLNQAIDRVVQVLAERPQPVGDADRIGVVRRPSAAFVAAVLGCERAGAAFAVIEPAGPDGPATGAGLSTVLDVSPAGDVDDRNIDLWPVTAEAGPSGERREVVSGSSASDAPDGDWAVEQFELGRDDRFAVLSHLPGHLQAAMSSAFHAGATLLVPDSSVIGDIGALTRWLQNTAITVLYLNPRTLRALTAQAARPQLPALRYAFIGNSGGLIARDIDGLRRTAAGCQGVGVYRVGLDGRPLAVYPVPKDWDLRTAPLRVPLGTELAGSPAQLRHPAGQLAGIGEVAEICFGSYRTGDRGRRWPDGRLEFVGATAREAFAAEGLGSRW